MVEHCTLDVLWLPMHIQMLIQSIFICEEALVTDKTAEISVSMSHEMPGKKKVTLCEWEEDLVDAKPYRLLINY